MNPGPLFIIRNTFYLLLLAFTFSALINFENTKIYLLLATTTKNPKIPLFTCFSLLSSFSFLSSILFIVIYFTNTEALCLTTTRWSWGHKTKTLFCRLLDEVGRSFAFVPREFDINPESPLWGKFLLLHHSALGVPTK